MEYNFSWVSCIELEDFWKQYSTDHLNLDMSASNVFETVYDLRMTRI